MGSGTLRFIIKTANGDLPVAGATILVVDNQGNVLYEEVSNADGSAPSVTLTAPDKEASLDPNYTGEVFGSYNVRVSAQGYRPVEIIGVQIFDGESSYLPVIMEPLADGNVRTGAKRVTIGCNALQDPTPREPEHDGSITRVLREVIIPKEIRVKLGQPNSHAMVERVPFIDYIKNVASSEIYPDWPKVSLEANILCQISLVLNRVYTEWYPSRGNNFDITNSTQFDQYYVSGRNIFDSVSVIVDRIFNHYIRRTGFKEPYYAEYCNGTSAKCPGLSQWGTVALANQGYSPMEILKYYYPKDIEIVICERFENLYESYPGYALQIGSTGEYVQTMQLFLNRISGDFPNIPKITNPNGVFGTETQAAVKEFQKTFGLTPDGIIGRATWNYISRIYVAVKRMAQLTSEGERLGIGKVPPSATIRQGARGENVVLLQHILNYLSEFYSSIPPVLQTGVFDAATVNAVKAFQQEFGLSQDGVVGPATWRALYDAYNGAVGNGPNIPNRPEEYPGYPLRQGSSGNSVKLIQNYLNAIADVFPEIPKITADGIFGPATASAVREYQRLFHLTVDGIVGPSTWNSIVEQYNLLDLNTYPGTALRVGSRGQDVMKMQRFLNLISTKYPTIPKLMEDGIFGNGTAAAVREFQRIFGLGQDGVIGLNTWNAIVREHNKISGGPTGNFESPVFPGTALRRGSSGDNVRLMQNYLNNLSNHYGLPRIVVDGSFGQSTENAVKAFQQMVGLPADGIIGQDTWKAISDSYWNLTNRDAMISAMGRMIAGKMIMG